MSDREPGYTVVYIGLGSNLGDRAANLRGALEALRRREDIEVVEVSPFQETEPVGPPQPRYLNAAARVRTPLSPRELLEVLQEVEEQFGRERSVRWGPRTLDLDILLYGERIVDQPDLRIPHPRMHERRFVLGPLRKIAPEAVHPVLDKTVRRLLRELKERPNAKKNPGET